MKSIRTFAVVFLLCTVVPSPAQNMSLRLTSPAKNARFVVCNDILLSAEASVQTGQVKTVEFYINGAKFKADTKAPYETTWPSVPDGIYELFVKGIEDDGAVTFTEPIFVYVGNTAPGNAIINGEFNCALSPWFLDNYVNAVSTCTMALDLGLTDDPPGVIIDIQNQGDQTWAIQLMQPFKIKAGHTYEVSFWAQADGPKAISVAISKNYDDYAPLFNTDIVVDQLDKFGPFIYTPTADDNNLMFKFVLGGNTISFYLDAVVVIDKEWTSIKVSEPVTSSFDLMQNFPNPFNPQTTITYSLENSGLVELAIYNIIGAKVNSATAVEQAGHHTFIWNGADKSGESCPSGVYIYQLRTATGFLSKKMHLLR